MAFSDYAAFLAEEAVNAEAYLASEDGGGSAEDWRILRYQNWCEARMDMYDAWVYSSDAGTSSDAGYHYVVEIWPKWEVCMGPPDAMYGGGADYEIDPVTYTILRREFPE